MPADTGRVVVYQYRTGKTPMCKTVDHCYKGGSKTVVDQYHSGNNLGTAWASIVPVLQCLLGEYVYIPSFESG